MITKTIGGDRLGSGKKMKQSYHNYERSNHDLSYIWRSTMSPATLVPFLSMPLLPGDSFDIELNTKTLTHPTIGPLFGTYKLQLDVFMIPVRLYQAQLHNNKTNIGMNMENIRLPLVSIEANNLDFNSDIPVDLQQINPSSLLKYLGISGTGYNPTAGATQANAAFNAIPYLAYYDIYKNYYANKQEEIGAFINYSNPELAAVTTIQIRDVMASTDLTLPASIINQATIISVSGVGLTAENIRVTITKDRVTNNYPLTSVLQEIDTTEDRNISGFIQNWVVGAIVESITVYSEFKENPTPQISTFPLSNIDDMRENILERIKQTTPFTVASGVAWSPMPYNSNLEKLTTVEGSKIRSYMPMQGLALKTYQSDLFNNWISTEWIDGENGISAITAVDVSAGLLQLDTLNLQQKVYNMLNRIAISGGSYYDWIEAVWTEEAFKSAETPIYMGGLSKEIVFEEVISNSATSDQPLGSLAGRGTQSQKHKGGKITIKSKGEHCYVMGIVSLTPRVDYSQGNRWDVNLQTMNDFHKPALDGIGYQDLITDQMAFWDTQRDELGNPTYRSAGKQPAWINYMTAVNQTYGNFADERNEMFMTLNRRYTPNATDRTIEDLTTYIDPAKYNYIFAEVDRGAQNFWVQIAVDISARRKVSARQIPNL